MWAEYVMTELLERRYPSGRLRRYEGPLSLIHRVADASIILLCLWAAYEFTGEPLSPAMAMAGLVAAIVFYVLAESKDLYRSWRTERVTKESWSAFEAWLGVAGISVVAVYLQQDVAAYPPATLAFWFIVTPILLIASRLGARLMLRAARARGFNTRKMAIAGSGELARQVARTVSGNPWMGFEIVGLFDDPELSQVGYSDHERHSFDVLVDRARRGEMDVVYIALPPGRAERQTEDLIHELSDSTASVYLVQDRRSRDPDGGGGSRQTVPDLRRVDVLHRTFVDLSGIKAVSVYESPFVGRGGSVKRFEDILVSSLALLLLALPMAAIALAVKFTGGPGPVFFKQRRYGLDGREIMVWKFRSMTVCEDGDSVAQARQGDARVTRIGAFLRKTSLDELPQFINVLQGSMSIVGPRPHAVAHNEYYRGLIGGYMLRHKVKPGITGWAQVNGWRGETDSVDKMGRRVDFDLDYIRNWSFWLDIRIIAMTAIHGFVHKNAY